jgi:hypothetical protein
MSVPTDRVEEEVAELRTAAIEHADDDTYEAYLGTNVERGMRIGVGLLAIERVSEGTAWLRAVATASTDRLSPDPVKEITRLRDEYGYDDIREYDHDLVSWQRGALAAILSGDQSTQHAVGELIYTAATADVVAHLENKWAEPRLDVDAALGAALTSRDVAPHIEAARQQLANPNCRAFHRGLYSPLVDALEAIETADTGVVDTSIEALDEFHATNRQDYETTTPLERFLNTEAMAVIAHARQRGIPVEYASEYVPESVSDPTYYPVK